MTPSKQPKPITPDAWELFKQIRHGDVLLIGQSKRPRLVLSGPADDLSRRPQREIDLPTTKMHIQLPIHRRSWTKRAYTLVSFHELAAAEREWKGSRAYSPAWVYRPATARDICGIERDTLKLLGFDWARELLRELTEQERLERRGLAPITAENKRWLRRFAERALRKASTK